jgi:hypothetical protein
MKPGQFRNRNNEIMSELQNSWNKRNYFIAGETLKGTGIDTFKLGCLLADAV